MPRIFNKINYNKSNKKLHINSMTVDKNLLWVK